MTDIITNLIQYLRQIYNFPFEQSLVIMLILVCLYVAGNICIEESRRSFTLRKAFFGLLLSFYISQVIGITLLNRVMEEEVRYDLNFFEVYKIAFEGNSVFATQLIGNVVMFIPFGLLLPLCFESLDGFFRVLFVSLLFSLFIETVQLFTHTGIFELPDLMNNTVGGVIGFLIYRVVRWMVKK